jgi:LPS-assembly protein
MQKQKYLCLTAVVGLSLFPLLLVADGIKNPSAAVARAQIADQLGWVKTPATICHGYYFEPAFIFPAALANTDRILVSSQQGIFSLHGTSIGQGHVTVTKVGEQVIANKALLYRDPKTGKINAIDLSDHVRMREPNNLVLASHAYLNIKDKSQLLENVLYRMTIYSEYKPKSTEIMTNKKLQHAHKITQLSVWGHATHFIKNQPGIYHFKNATYTTCPPLMHSWKLVAQKLTLDKNTGRGVARNAKVYFKNIPVFYAPYFNFPIDSRRQTGFLNPTFGSSSKMGPYLRAPFYLNLAPNYDMTLTPAILSKRGINLTTLFRYLTPNSNGTIDFAILPNDKLFADFKTTSAAKYGTSTDPIVSGNLKRLQNSSNTRTAFAWQNDSRYNHHWSSTIDYSYVSDDYYLRDLNNTLNEVTQNQLLQQAELDYKNTNWNFLGRVQSYQTLHGVDEGGGVKNQYSRFPQLVLEGDYPNMPGGFEYFISNDLTHFDIRNSPGDYNKYVMGNRLNIQPGIALPINKAAFYIVPRMQLSMTQYDLGHVTYQNKSITRTIPIVDISSGLYFDRNIQFLHNYYRQTLEPQIYYIYVPYHNQSKIPIFDTSLNNFTYDELFTYNRFSGLDRIGDANQVSVGLTTRFIDEQSGIEKIRAGIGEILYFTPRLVTLCNENDPTCTADVPNSPINRHTKSPLVGSLSYNVNPDWSFGANSTWNPKTNQLDRQDVGLHYQSTNQRIVNLGYTYLRHGDQQANDLPDSSAGNLSQTDMSFAWPVFNTWSAVGRWTQNWNHHHFQNVLYGVQYDTCCWAVRFVSGRAFIGLDAHNKYQYNTEFFMQFALKGFTTLGTGDPSQLLGNSIGGYQNYFGQDF